MNKNVQRVFLLTTLLVVLVGLGALSAADVSDNTTTTQSVAQDTPSTGTQVAAAVSDTNDNKIVTDTKTAGKTKSVTKDTQINTKKETKNNITKNIKKDEKTVNITVNNYTDLKNNLYNTTTDNLIINLNQLPDNEKYEVSEFIDIVNCKSTHVTINGNNQTITGGNNIRFFRYNGGPSNVTINNITIANIKVSDKCPISTYGNLTLNNVNFVNNSGTHGAVSQVKGTLKLVNCTIENCSGQTAGAIENKGTAELINCTIRNNKVTRSGSDSIIISGPITIDNCLIAEPVTNDNSNTITVITHNTTMNIDVSNSTDINNAIYINGTLLNDMGTSTSDLNIKILVNNEEIANVTTDKNGRFNYTYTPETALNNANLTVMFHGTTVEHISGSKYNINNAGYNASQTSIIFSTGTTEQNTIDWYKSANWEGNPTIDAENNKITMNGNTVAYFKQYNMNEIQTVTANLYHGTRNGQKTFGLYNPETQKWIGYVTDGTTMKQGVNQETGYSTDNNVFDADIWVIDGSEKAFTIDVSDKTNVKITYTAADGTTTPTVVIPVGTSDLSGYYLAFQDNGRSGMYVTNLSATSINITNTTVKDNSHIIIDDIPDTIIGSDIIISGTLLDSNNNTIPNAAISIEVNNEKIATVNTDANGKYSYNYTTKIAGDNNITVIYEGNRLYNNSTNTKTVNIESKTPVSFSLINNTTNPFDVYLNEEYNITIRINYGETALSNVSVKIYVDDILMDTCVTDSTGVVSYTYSDYLNDEHLISFIIDDKQYEGNYILIANVLDPINTNIVINPVDASVSQQTIITAGITDINNNTVNRGEVTFTDASGNILGTAAVTNGTASINYTFNKLGSYNIIAVYNSTSRYNSSKTSYIIQTHKTNTTITVQPVTAFVNDIVSLTASITDNNNNAVNSGRVAFEVNGRAIRNSDGKVRYVNVENGTATLENFTIPRSYLGSYRTISAVYSGTGDYQYARSAENNISISKRVADLEIISPDTSVVLNSTVALTVKVTDNKANVNSGKVVFKFDGRSVRDNTGKVLYANVENGTATMNYTIPNYYNIGTYKFTAVFYDELYERSTISSTITTTVKDIKSVKSVNNFKNIKTLKTEPKTHIVTNETFNQYFTKALLNDNVTAGDTLDFRGVFHTTDVTNYTMNINKPVNIISSTQDTNISLNTTSTDFFGQNPGDAFVITSNGSGTNMTGLYFYNTQIFVRNATHVNIKNLTVIDEYQVVGGGVGVLSVRENSSYVTVKDCQFRTENNGGHSTLVGAFVNHCTFDNNTITGVGNVGNLLYLTTYNVDLHGSKTTNDYNIISNNKLQGPKQAISICYGIAICGCNNLIENNTVNYSRGGMGITTQWGSGTSDWGGSGILTINNTYINNTVNNASVSLATNSTAYNNTFDEARINSGCDVYNNTINTAEINGVVNFHNNLVGNITLPVQNGNKNVLIANNSINNTISIEGGTSRTKNENITIVNNTINSNITITGTSGYVSNINISSNNINGTINLGSARNQRINNASVINNTIITDNENTISLTQRASDINITHNYLVAKNSKADNSISIKGSNIQINDNGPRDLDNKLRIEVADFDGVIIGDDAVINGTFTDENNTPISGADIILAIDNEDPVTVTTGNDGTFTYNYTTKEVKKDIAVTAKFEGDFDYRSNEDNTMFNVQKMGSTITIDTINNTIVNTEVNITGKIAEEYTDKAIPNAIVMIKTNDKTYNTTTDEEGKFNTTITAPGSAGIYNITVNYDGNGRYDASNYVTSYDVEKTGSKIDINNINSALPETQVTLTGKLTEEYTGNPIKDTPITIIISNKTYNTTTNEEGKFNTTITAPNSAGTYNITVNYDGNNLYENSNATTKITILRLNTTATVEPVNGILNKTVTFTAHVKDENGDNVTGGYVIFKVNDVTLKDDNKTPIQVNVINGTAILETTATWSKAETITVSYSGSNTYKAAPKNSNTINITRQNATVKLEILTENLKPGNEVVAVVRVTDENDDPISNGAVIFKLNGKTLKYTNGLNIMANVTNGTARFNYIIPENYSAKNYTLTAVYSGVIYNKETAAQNITLNKLDSNVNMNILSNEFKPGSEIIAIATVNDLNNNPVTRGHVTFKLNDKTITDNDTRYVVNITNGVAVLNYTIPSNYSAKTYKLSAVFGGSNFNTKEATQNITLNKINTYIEPGNITITNNTLHVKATIKNAETTQLANQRNNTVSIKLDKHTVIKDVKITNGIIDLNTTINNTKTGKHIVELITSGNNIYNPIKTNITITN